ncbi:hypothetical protein KXD40_005866 [Peronospora effusa]|uniref:Secreted protein n=1 Tax=Peronospora effusa TaxID=542832 RepID=A0A3M6VL66_9STRA|nr:hypothetical protein DD238_003180 [Peronospora effusa]RQM10254.1 hypothetical protein DD237_002308 [Peronospora effusa]UIZ27472.1 hypothetical protein KXD40_005866 [Peronospora effusa]
MVAFMQLAMTITCSTTFVHVCALCALNLSHECRVFAWVITALGKTEWARRLADSVDTSFESTIWCASRQELKEEVNRSLSQKQMYAW